MRWGGARFGAGFVGVVLATGTALAAPVVSDEAGTDAPVYSTRSNGLISSTPALAFNGTHVVAAWSGTGLGTNGSVYLDRADASGTALDPMGVRVGNGGGPRLACTTQNCLMAHTLNPHNVVLRRLALDNSVLDAEPIPLAVESYTETLLNVCASGTQYTVLWADYRSGENQLYLARVAQDGTVLDVGGILVTNATYILSAACAHDGTNTLVVWNEGPYDNQDVVGRRLDQSGLFLDDPPLIISAAAGNQTQPVVAFGGGAWQVAWQDARTAGNHHIYTTRVAPDGMVSNTTGTNLSPTTATALKPAMAFNGTNFLAVWKHQQNGQFDVQGVRLSAAGQVLDTGPVRVGGAVGDQEDAEVTGTPAGFVVMFEDPREGNLGVYVNALGNTGMPANPLGDAFPRWANKQSIPAVAAGTNQFLMVWEDNRDPDGAELRAMRLDAAGNPLDVDGFSVRGVGYRATQPAVAFGGGQYLVAWAEGDAATRDIKARRFGLDGLPVDATEFTVSAAGNAQEQPAVASDGTNFYVVWQDKRPPGVVWRVYGAAVTNGVAGTNQLIYGQENGSTFPAISHRSNGVYLVVFEVDPADNSTQHDIKGVIINPNGIGGLLALAIHPASQTQATIASNGTGWLVVWRDYRNAGYQYDLMGTRVDATGAALDPAGIPLVLTPATEFQPALAHDGTRYVLAWDTGVMHLDNAGMPLGSTAINHASPAQDVALAALPGQNTAVLAYGRRILEAPFASDRVRRRQVAWMDGAGSSSGGASSGAANSSSAGVASSAGGSSSAATSQAGTSMVASSGVGSSAGASSGAAVTSSSAAGASSQGVMPPAAGTQDGPCYGNNTCNDGLECENGTCVPAAGGPMSMLACNNLAPVVPFWTMLAALAVGLRPRRRGNPRSGV